MTKDNNSMEERFEKKFIVVIQDQQEQSRAMEEALSFIRQEIKTAKEEERKEISEKIIKERPFVDLTRDWAERRKIEGYLDKWEQRIKKLLN